MSFELESRPIDDQHADDDDLPDHDDPAASFVEVSDDWLDESLRTVSLPEGFITRMVRLAHSGKSLRDSERWAEIPPRDFDAAARLVDRATSRRRRTTRF